MKDTIPPFMQAILDAALAERGREVRRDARNARQMAAYRKQRKQKNATAAESRRRNRQ